MSEAAAPAMDIRLMNATAAALAGVFVLLGLVSAARWVARLPGFGDLHPLAPASTTQGALELISQLMNWLTTLTGMPAVAMSPKAGAHGELCGLLAIRAAIAARGEDRKRVLVPESAGPSERRPQR